MFPSAPMARISKIRRRVRTSKRGRSSRAPASLRTRLPTGPRVTFGVLALPLSGSEISRRCRRAPSGPRFSSGEAGSWWTHSGGTSSCSTSRFPWLRPSSMKRRVSALFSSDMCPFHSSRWPMLSPAGEKSFGILELAPIGSKTSCKADTDPRSYGELLKLPDSKETLRARTPTLHHRTHLGTVPRLAARKKSGSSARLSSSPHSRLRSLQEAHRGSRIRLRLLEDRRRGVLGHYAAPVAALMLALGWRSGGGSWVTDAPAVGLLGGAALLERLTGGGGEHAVVAGAVGVAAV